MCSGGKALSTASFPQTHRKKARQAVPMSVVSVSAFRVVDSDEHFCQCTMRGAVLQRWEGQALSNASFPQKHGKTLRQAVPMCTVSVVSQLISSISLSLCESRPGVAESNHRHGRGAKEEVAQIAPSQKAAQANCKIARTLPRVTSDQN